MGCQRRSRVGDQLGVVDVCARSRRDVRRQQCFPTRARNSGGDGLRDARVAAQHVVDLAELDAETADLDLEVAPAEVLQLTLAVPPREVTRAVHALSRNTVGVGNKSFGRNRGTRVVPARQTDTAHIELAGDTDRHRLKPRVQEDGCGAAHRLSDGDGNIAAQWSGQSGDDGGFGRSVRVEHRASV